MTDKETELWMEVPDENGICDMTNFEFSFKISADRELITVPLHSFIHMIKSTVEYTALMNSGVEKWEGYEDREFELPEDYDKMSDVEVLNDWFWGEEIEYGPFEDWVK